MTTIDQQRIDEQAADWVTRIQSGDVNPDRCDELRQWLTESDRHQLSFQTMVGVMSRSDILAGTAHSPVAAGNPAALASRNWLAAAASVIVAIAAGTWFLQPTGPSIQTYTGERVLMTLEDGSSIHLNADSSIDIQFTDTERLAFVETGEVVFTVNKIDSRPFLVRAENLDVEVTGTTFQVSGYDKNPSVSVLEGSVLVRANAQTEELASRGTGEPVGAGFQVRLQNGDLSKPLAVDVNRAAAWREGWLYLDNRPLRELIDRLNRQYDGHIEIASAPIADSAVSVAVRIGRRDETLDQLEILLPIRFEELPGERYVVHAQP